MGFNTAMVVLNDCLNEIEKDPSFGMKVSEAVREAYGSGRVDRHSSFKVLPSEHADWGQLVVVGGNSIRRFDALGDEEKLALLKRLALHAGYRLSRIPA